MGDIFISYARDDREIAQRFVEEFELRGWSVWWDLNISFGMSFHDVIAEKLREAKCVVVLWSKKSVISSYVRDEAGEGKERGILVPVLIESAVLPVGFRSIQTAQLIGWDKKRANLEFNLLTESIARIIGSPTNNPTPIAGASPTPYILHMTPDRLSIRKRGGSGHVTLFLTGVSDGSTITASGPSNLTIFPSSRTVSANDPVLFKITSSNNDRGNFTVTFYSPYGSRSIIVTVTN